MWKTPPTRLGMSSGGVWGRGGCGVSWDMIWIQIILLVGSLERGVDTGCSIFFCISACLRNLELGLEDNHLFKIIVGFSVLIVKVLLVLSFTIAPHVNCGWLCVSLSVCTVFVTHNEADSNGDNLALTRVFEESQHGDVKLRLKNY